MPGDPPLPPIGNGPAAALPDLILTAVSLVFLFSSPNKTSKNPRNRISCPIYPRRFLKIPTMSRRSPPTPALPPISHPHRFANPQCLSDWLESRLPSGSFALWGVRPGTKNVHNLWLELTDGETSLADSTPPIRTVSVVSVRIVGKDNLILVESHQELSDGSVRERFRPLSEKMKPDETPEEAVFRAVKEELGSIVDGGDDVRRKVKVLPDSYCSRVEERNSFSYPGLPARYVLHSLDVVVDGLPESDFCTDEQEYGECCAESEGSRVKDKAVTVRRHHWKWVSPDSIQP